VKKGYVITLDGPAGAGKSTVAKELARKLCYTYLDTGALYRALAYKMVQEGVSSEDTEKFNEFCHRTRIKLENTECKMRVFVDDEEVTDKIRTEKIGSIASRVSAIPIVREILFHVQRDAGKDGSIIAEGRDMGTVIFPDAEFKFFLEADVDERVRRRCRELLEKGDPTEYEQIEDDLINRDKQDRERKISPLIPSDNAVVIDSTHMTVSDVVGKIISIVRLQSCI
jgi:CMP/dCMP kinase